MYSKELLKGTIEIIILKLLVEKGSMYGYEITQQVKTLTKGKIVISEGALYPTLHKLKAVGVLSTEIIHIGRRQRKYYHVSEAGKGISASKMQELSSFLHSLNQILDFKLST